MKRCTVLLTLALILGLSGIVAAAGINVTADYLLGGNAEWWDEWGTSKVNGFALGADATIPGPFGAKLEYVTLTPSDWKTGLSPDVKVSGKFTNLTIAGTYLLPVGGDNLKVKAVVGYTMPKFEETEDTVASGGSVETWTDEFKGFVFGADVDYALMDKLNVFGKFSYAPVKVDEVYQEDGVELSSGPGEGSSTEYNVGASYQVTERLSIEAGYRVTSLSFKWDSGGDDSHKLSGFYVGGRANF